MPRGLERIAGGLLAAALLLLRGLAFFRYRFDSDESQHLHVAWGWSQGLLPYRDVFDNHTPLFHLLTAPIIGVLGERANILHWMRAPMIVLWLVVCLATFCLARRFGASAWWAVLLLNAIPPFFLKSLEFRTDNLWLVWWMLALLVLATRSALTPWRAALGGLLLGTALATSMKTSILIITLIAASLFTWRRVKPAVGWMLPTFAIVPAMLIVYFSNRGVWSTVVYCVITFNEQVKAGHMPLRLAIWIVVLAAGAAATWRTKMDEHLLFLTSFCFVYVVTVVCFWSLITPRDFLSIFPLLAILAAAAPIPRWTLPAAAALMLIPLYYYAERFHDRTREYTTMMNQALHLSRPGEPVMDLKGETIYRRRPFYYPFEAITRSAMQRGLIADTIPEDVVRARCYVAQADGPYFPARGRDFLAKHFVDLGRLRAAGAWIGGYDEFEIAVAGPYVFVGNGGEVRGLLDGVPYAGGPRELAAGEHHFVPEKKERLAVLWAPAFARGFSPFHHRDKDF